MKAIVQDRYGPPEVLRLDDIDPPEPGEGELLVRVRAAAVDPGVWHLMTGLPYLVRLFYGPRTPKVRVRGRDAAGTVAAVGAKVDGFRVGDEVFGACEGSYAEYALLRQDRAAPKPPNLTFEQAAAIPVSGTTALRGLRDTGGIRAGQRVLVIGAAGGIGTFAVQLARAFGARVTGVCSTAKTDLVRSLGADEAIDYTREDFADRSERYDLVVDTAGNRRLSHLRRVLTPTGTLVIVGGESGGRWTGGFERSLAAPPLSPFVGQRLRALAATENSADLWILAEHAEAGRLTPVIGRTYPLERVPEAIGYLAKHHARGKIAITVSGD